MAENIIVHIPTPEPEQANNEQSRVEGVDVNQNDDPYDFSDEPPPVDEGSDDDDGLFDDIDGFERIFSQIQSARAAAQRDDLPRSQRLAQAEAVAQQLGLLLGDDSEDEGQLTRAPSKDNKSESD